jgi:hypothetical protein
VTGKKNLFSAAGAFLLLLVLPLLGVWLAGRDVSLYLEFPPVTRYVSHAHFSWAFFIALTVVIVAIVLPFQIRVFRRCKLAPAAPVPVRKFPWWGILSLFFGLVFWILAWTRFPWFKSFQLYTFTPLWLSFILFVNALTFRRTGRCLLKNRPRFFCLLFPLSALFWWFFEYLNRFVQNWYYVGEEVFTKLEYFLLASLSFSTVLPAVLSIYALVKSMPRVGAGLSDFIPVRIRKPRAFAGTALVVSGAGLALIGLLPDFLFPLLWLSPLIIIVSIQAIRGKHTIFSPLEKGDWSRIYTLALTALVCGFFWEMWNFFSLAKWVYEVPFVSRFKLFEMPILGYFGYLPFGLECAVIGDMLAKRPVSQAEP